MTFWCLAAPHPAWIIRLWLVCDVCALLSRWLNSANRSLMYRLAARNAMTNGADTDFSFVSLALSDACLWNFLLLKLGRRLWSVLFFFICNKAPKPRSCVGIQVEKPSFEACCHSRDLNLVCLASIAKGTFNHGQHWKAMLSWLDASKRHEVAEDRFIHIAGTISLGQCTAFGGQEMLWFVRK